jgi:O-antigen/teichoic acid export membrane protein
VWAGIPYFGLEATGIGFFVMYVINLPLVFWLARRRMQLRWSRPVKMIFISILISALAVVAMCAVSPVWGALMDCVVVTGFLCFAIARLRRVSEISGRLAKLLMFVARFFGRER